MQAQLQIILDDRELKSATAKHLFSLGMKLIPKRLEVADYIISETICVERKTASDFEGSVIDGRLFEQAQAMSQNFSSPLLAIVGTDFYRLNPKAILGAQISLATDYRIPLFMFESEEDFAEFLHALVKQKSEPGKEIALRHEKPSLTSSQQQQFIVESLPLIGPSLAKNLLKRFKTVENVFNASEEELMDVEGVGELKAKAIRKIIGARYEE